MRNEKRSHRLWTSLLALILGIAAELSLGATVGAIPAPLGRGVGARSYSVGITRCTFVDRSRAVPDYATNPVSTLSGSRTLVTEIRYPTGRLPAGVGEATDAMPVARRGGYPMIVFAHGYDVTPDTYAPLLDAWVRAGYVVAAPIFPDESAGEVAAQHGVNTEDDLVNEPADLAFVTRRVLRASAGPDRRCPLLRGLVRPSELALAGHSDGATVVGMLSFAEGRDPQGESYEQLRAGLSFRVTIIMSGEEDGVDPYAPLAPDAELLVIQSAADQCNAPRNAVKLYDDIGQENKWFLELLSAHHLPPFDGADGPAFDVVVNTSLRFLALTLDGASRGESLAVVGDEEPAVARLLTGNHVPAITAVPTGEACGPN